MTTPMPVWYPKAARKNIKPGDNDPPITPNIVSFHVAATNLLSLFPFFNGPSGGIESHLYLLKDGTWEQYRRFDREADAQLGGNSWEGAEGKRWGSITIETQGLGPLWWTRAQKAELKEFALWAHRELGIPLRVPTVPNPTTLGRGGFGYHSLFDEWNSLGKTCPGPRRIAWFDKVFRPFLRQQSLQEFDDFRIGESITDFARRNDVSVARLWRLNRPVPQAGERMRVR